MRQQQVLPFKIVGAFPPAGLVRIPANFLAWSGPARVKIVSQISVVVGYFGRPDITAVEIISELSRVNNYPDAGQQAAQYDFASFGGVTEWVKIPQGSAITLYGLADGHGFLLCEQVTKDDDDN